MSRPFDLLKIVGIGEAVAVAVACRELQATVGDELGHLTLHAGVNHAVLFPPITRVGQRRRGEEVPMVEIQQRGHQSLEAFRMMRAPM